MNRKITALITSAAVALGLTVAGVVTAAPASAHTPSVSADCSALTVNLTNYAASTPGKDIPNPDYKAPWDETVHHAAVGTPTITVNNPDYKPAVAAQPGSYDKYTWQGNYGAPHAAPPGAGWHEVGVTSDTKGSNPDQILKNGNAYFYFKTLKAPVPAQPAVGTPTITIPNPDYKAAWDEVVHHAAVGTPTIHVDGKTNHVTVTDNGASLADTDFSTSYSHTFPSSDKTIAHDYVVKVTSLDGIGAGTWTKHVNACETPLTPVTGTPVITVTGPTCDALFNTISYDIPKGLSIAGYTGKGSVKDTDLGLAAGEHTYNVDVDKGYKYDGPKTVTFTTINPNTLDCRKTVEAKTAAEIVTTCGAADLTLTNPQAENEINKTGAATVWIDGKFVEAIAVPANATETRHYTFPEDSGDHTIVVKNAEFAGGKTLAEATVHSDCLPAEDATAAVTVTAPTCDKDGSAAVDTKGTVNATLVGKLDTTPGTHTAAFVADKGHAFKGGKTWLEVEYTVKAKTGNCPVVVPPANPPAAVSVLPKAVTPVAPTEDVLAHTGSDALGTGIGFGAAAVILLGLGTAFTVAGVKRRKATQE